jgi:hypothetical protein
MERLRTFFVLMLAALIALASCKKDKEDDSNDSNNTPTPTAITWNLNAQVDLGGVFTVIGTGAITINGSAFTAVITTSTIGGAAEVYNFSINGTISGSTYSVTNQTFTVGTGSPPETVTITSGTHTVNGNNLTGNGSVSVVPAGGGAAMPGTYTVTGTK